MFLATFLSTTSLNFFKTTGTVFKLPTSKPSTFVSKLSKLVGTLTNFLISSLPTSALKATKSCLAAKLNALVPVTSFNHF